MCQLILSQTVTSGGTGGGRTGKRRGEKKENCNISQHFAHDVVQLGTVHFFMGGMVGFEGRPRKKMASKGGCPPKKMKKKGGGGQNN